MFFENSSTVQGERIMLVGCDKKHILQKRLEAAGAQVIRVSDGSAALDYARRERLHAAVLVSKGALIDDAEIVFNLRDLHRELRIFLLIDRVKGERKRLLQQLMEHPIAGTKWLPAARCKNS
jgi:DNA-binding response OmpR family regulator